MNNSSGNIRVLSVCTSDVSGGAARAAYRIHEGVQARGVESCMFVKHKGSQDQDVHPLSELVPDNPLYNAMDWVASKVKNKQQHWQWSKYPNRSKYYMSDMRSTRIHGALQAFDYDVLHLHWVNQRFLPLEELLKVKKPIVWTLHDSWPFCGVCHYFLDCDGYKRQCGSCPMLGSDDADDLSHQIWQRKHGIYKNLDLHIVAPSHWLADCARQSSLFAGLDIRVIPNCLPTEIFSPIDTKARFVGDETSAEKRFEKPFVLYGAVAAATDRRKGFSNLLSALQILDKQGESDFDLVVFGANEQDSPFSQSNGSAVARLHNMNIRYVGYIHDTDTLVDLYRRAAVMVVPSQTENLSCAIMEAMGCGTPVVAFDIGGNGDMIEHLQNGYLARERDDADLAAGIRWCLDNNRDNRLGTAARKKVLENFTTEIVSGKYIDLYHSLL